MADIFVAFSGKFVRKDAVYRGRIRAGGEFPPESGRYVLYVSLACPWACRCYAVRNLKKLQKHIELCVVYPTWQATRPGTADKHMGWAFWDYKNPPKGLKNPAGNGSFGPIAECTADTINGKKFVRDIYEVYGEVDTHTYSVPILFDRKTNKIVCNESSVILQDLNKAFDGLPGVDSKLDLRSAGDDEVNEWIYHSINNGVYKTGFAKSQAAYEEAFQKLFTALDRVEAILAKSRFLTNNEQLTLADIRLFVTLIRFDEVYAVYFKCNGRLIREYPNMLNYCRDLFQTPGVQETVNMEHIKNHYYTSHPNLNLYGIVPLGPEGMPGASKLKGGGPDIFRQRHDRARCNQPGGEASCVVS